ncbi:unnamed protein product [Leptidea sinapis]|uniref:Uncharacterized protein n=1 Tax=Leptidea sinapis TaxID=189913 RepID=A0A5E4Q0N4_9NEOP|nr:unnamed protein product [Leptidea sinapis]
MFQRIAIDIACHSQPDELKHRSLWRFSVLASGCSRVASIYIDNFTPVPCDAFTHAQWTPETQKVKIAHHAIILYGQLLRYR